MGLDELRVNPVRSSTIMFRVSAPDLELEVSTLQSVSGDSDHFQLARGVISLLGPHGIGLEGGSSGLVGSALQARVL